MNERLELSLLNDFYGPLLTDGRRDLMRCYYDDDMSISEIAEQLKITRQAVSDSLKKARNQLYTYEKQLGMVKMYRAITREAERCLEQLDVLESESNDGQAIYIAREAIKNILKIER